MLRNNTSATKETPAMRMQRAPRDRAHLPAALLSLCALSLLAAWAVAPAIDCRAAELGWSYPPAGPLRVHAVQGYSYYTRNYRVDEVLARAGVNLVTESTQEDRGVSQWGGTSAADAGWLRDCADPAGFAMDHHLVIVCSVGASGFGESQQVLVDFVKHGGAVLLLCDSYAFGDRTGRSAFAELAPLEFPDEGPWTLETESASEGVALKPGPDCDAKQLPGAVPDNPPRVYSFYKVKAKPDAKVLLAAGEGAPILIVGEFGKGRVAVFTASCRGYAKKGQIPYWEWSGWPSFMAATLQQLAAGAGDAMHGLDENGRRAVAEAMNRAYDLLDGADEQGRREFEALLDAATRRCHDKPTAEFLLGLVAEYPLDLPGELAATIGQALSPYLDDASAETTRKLVESGQPGRTILGLIALGAAGGDNAGATLEEFLATGTPRARSGSVVSLATADPPSVEAVMQAEQDAAAIRRAAVMGMGTLGDPDALPALKDAADRYAAEGRYQADSQAAAIEPAHRDYQNAVLAALLSGDTESAGPVVDFLVENVSVISRAPTEEGQRQSAVAWQQQLCRRLAAAPDGVVAALAKRIAAEQSSSVTTAALAALGGRELSPELAKLLSESSITAVAELGKRQIEQ
jgi:hypothetical protein